MRPHLQWASPAPVEHLRAIYIQDHLAGAAGGIALVRRSAQTMQNPEHARLMTAMADAIEDEVHTLRRCADALGIPRPRLREMAAVVMERIGRLKLNGQVLGTSPLSPILEIEALKLAVTGQASCWRTLATSGVAHRLPDDVDLEAFERRALDQRRELEQLYDELVAETLADRAALHPTPDPQLHGAA